MVYSFLASLLVVLRLLKRISSTCFITSRFTFVIRTPFCLAKLERTLKTSMMCGNHFIAYSMHAYEDLLFMCMILSRLDLVGLSRSIFYLLQHRPCHFSSFLS